MGSLRATSKGHLESIVARLTWARRGRLWLTDDEIKVWEAEAAWLRGSQVGGGIITSDSHHKLKLAAIGAVVGMTMNRVDQLLFRVEYICLKRAMLEMSIRRKGAAAWRRQSGSSNGDN